jgi:hypothetical protein
MKDDRLYEVMTTYVGNLYLLLHYLFHVHSRSLAASGVCLSFPKERNSGYITAFISCVHPSIVYIQRHKCILQYSTQWYSPPNKANSTPKTANLSNPHPTLLTTYKTQPDDACVSS